MLKLRIVAVLAVAVVWTSAARAEWKPAKAPVMTRWAKDVSPDSVHPEYPRPQMVRAEWLNLNGPWQYQIAAKDTPPPIGKDLPGEILVPFPVESALSGVAKRAEWLHYRRTVTVPNAWKDKRVLLHFGAVDWDATVYVNGTKVGTHRGGYDAFSFDVTDQAKIGQANEIVVTVWDPSSHGPQARGKQVDNPHGIWYTPTTGIWQTVWLEPVAATHVKSIAATPDIDAGTVEFSLKLAAQSGLTTTKIRILAEEKVVSEASISIGSVPGDARKDRPASISAPRVKMAVKDARLWSPDSPFLYDVEITVFAGDKLVDRVESYFGMRKISLGKDKDGFQRIMLNNKFVFQMGFLDQGFWPDGLYTAPTDAALRYDIEVSKQLGMNMARKHVKIEPQRWYYWCDKLGMLVWQDMPSGDTVKDRPQFQKELTALVTGMGNHPSIVLWVVFNEGWGQIAKGRGGATPQGRKDTQFHVDLVRKLDPTRLIINASGWTDYAGVGDVIDIHRYPGPGAPKPEPKRAGVLGEFGGLGLPIPKHLWQDKKNWGYRNMTDKADLTRRYIKLLQGVHLLKVTQGLSAAVYTQTTDVEGEVNGLMTYDRAVIKPDVAKIAAANRGEFPPPPKVNTLVPTSEETPQTWRVTTDKPGANWMKPDFDDTGWKPAKGGFGTAGTPGATVRTEWKTQDIWLRRTFDLKETDLAELAFRMHHDEDAEVYVNGVPACQTQAFTSEYDQFPLAPAAKAALKKGVNVLAVHCKQTRGGQYIDVGLIELVPRQKKP